MWLTDALYRNKDMTAVCCHHEQAAAMAADGYGRVNEAPGACLVTIGPGATNAITGVAQAYLDTMLKTVALAKKAGIPVLNMHLQRGVYVTLPERRTYIYAENQDFYLGKMREFRDRITEAIGSSDVMVCVENTDGGDCFALPFLAAAADTLLESPAFGLTLDVGHDYLNRNAERAMAVRNPVKVVITNLEEEQDCEFEINPNAEDGAVRTVKFTREIYLDAEDFSENPPPKYFRLKPDGYVRLKGAYIIHCDRVVKKADGSIDYLECTYIPESRSGHDESGIKVKGVVQWVSAKYGVPAKFNLYRSLLNPELPEGNFMDRLNLDSKTVLEGFVEPYLAEQPNGTRFQFLRLGYYIKDSADTYFEIVGLKDSFKK